MSTNKKKIMYGLIAVIILQMSVLLIEYGNTVYPLVTGKEIKIKVIPVDPRSLFRGNYARLNYTISSVQRPHDISRKLRNNEPVYVVLKENKAGLYEAETVSYSRPASGLFIKGRVKYEAETVNYMKPGSGLFFIIGRVENAWERDNKLDVRYGIEAFFLPKEKALDLESKLETGGVAIVMLAKNGNAALKNIVPD